MDILEASRIEDLLPGLLTRLKAPLTDPLAQDWVIVPSQGLQLWLTEQIARAMGICSWIDFRLPEAAVDALLALRGPNWPSAAEMAWQLMPVLEDLPADPSFSLIGEFLDQGRRNLDLALRMGELFRQYGLYRPEMLADWEAALPGPERASQRWQALLYSRLPGPRLTQLVQSLIEDTGPWPERIQVFGCSQMPPLLIELLQTAAKHCPVTIHHLALPNDFPVLGLNQGLRRATASALQADGNQTASAELPIVSVHACAGPMRELEALRDWLLERAQEDPNLTCADIQVLAPDPRPYQALLPLVFGREPALPLRLLGQRPLERSALLQAFEQVLALADSRMHRQQLLALLELEPLARRFDLDASERELCRHWLDRVNIRWGWDARQRGETTTVAFEENSWQAGIERLLLGYALGEGPELFQGVAPYSDIEGSQGQTLGKLLSLLEALRQTRRQLARRQRLGDWGRLLGNLLERFLIPLESEDWERLIALFSQLGDAERWYKGTVPLSRVRSWLRHQLRQLAPETLPGGRIACSSLEFMQMVPASIVCLLGLDDRSFPRQQATGELNLLMRDPGLLDPEPRSLDRELWLSALSSARKHVFVAYQGLSPRDGAVRPPSLLVSELCESWPGCPESAIVRHALQPPIAARLSELKDFCAEALPVPDGLILELGQLRRFWRNPAGFFLRARLDLGYAREEGPESDSELLDWPALEKYQLGQSLLGRSGSLEAEYQRLRAHSRLPVGGLGRLRFEEGANQAEAFARRKAIFEADLTAREWPFEIEIEGMTLSGSLELWPDGLRFSRFGALRPQELLEAWIGHLLLQCLDVPDSQKVTRLLGLDGCKRFDPVPEARMHLAGLLQLTREGLAAPLAFFPNTTRAYAEAIVKGASPESALRAAEAAWLGRPGMDGESSRPEWSVCFRRAPVLGPRFQELATAIWTPLLAAIRDEA